MKVSVIVPAHNPEPSRLRRVLSALSEQTLPASSWEVLVVDNASSPPIDAAIQEGTRLGSFRVVREPQLGLTAARRRGFAEALGEVLVLVDDDNLLAPDYLERVLEVFAAQPEVGAIGGKSVPEFESSPPAWVREFDSLLACRDLGREARVTDGGEVRPGADSLVAVFLPIGAGMAARGAALQAWMESPQEEWLTDRRGAELASGGDNDIAFSIRRAGWRLGYFPQLTLIHLIPNSRTTREYLSRLNRGISKSWIRVLAKHGVCPWPPIPKWTLPLRQVKAWFIYRAWSGPAAEVRWHGACGHFEGQAELHS